MKHFTLILMAVATICTQSFAQTRVRNIYADVKSLNVELLQNTDQTVQLNRHLFAGYNTLCMPMSMSAEQVSNAASDVRVERFVGIGQEGNTLYLYFMDCTDEGIQAGYPYLVYSPKTQYFRVKNTEAASISTELKNLTLSDMRACLYVLRVTRHSFPPVVDLHGTSSLILPMTCRSSISAACRRSQESIL